MPISENFIHLANKTKGKNELEESTLKRKEGDQEDDKCLVV
jgi:hypothetical protein